jgi:parallel beta-helix repeat protein
MAVPDCSGVTVKEGADLETAVRRTPPGTTLCLVGDFSVERPVRLKPRQILIGPAFIQASAGSPERAGLITSSGNVLEGLDISGFLIGISNVGEGVTIRNNRLHGNTRSGIGGPGGHALIEDNEVYRNGSTHLLLCCAAGIKYVGVGVTVRNNYVHHNSNGIWGDQDANGTLIEGNTVVDNLRKGIFFEISDGAVIRRNLVTGNNTESEHGHAGITIASSQNVKVYDNELGGNGRYGILAWENLRREPSHSVSIFRNQMNGDAIGGCDIATCDDNA